MSPPLAIADSGEAKAPLGVVVVDAPPQGVDRSTFPSSESPGLEKNMPLEAIAPAAHGSMSFSPSRGVSSRAEEHPNSCGTFRGMVPRGFTVRRWCRRTARGGKKLGNRIGKGGESKHDMLSHQFIPGITPVECPRLAGVEGLKLLIFQEESQANISRNTTGIIITGFDLFCRNLCHVGMYHTPGCDSLRTRDKEMMLDAGVIQKT